MKTIYLLFVLMFGVFNTFSQTELIAYKSHSGNMAYFKLSGFDNLGEPPIFIDSIIKLNDTTIIEYLSWGGNDTILNHPVCKLSQSSLDSLKGTYYNYSIQFIDFEPIQAINTDTVQTDSIINSIKTFGENETEEQKTDIIPIEEENTSPPIKPQTKSIISNPSSKLYILLYGLIGLVIMSIITLWFKLKPKLQV